MCAYFISTRSQTPGQSTEQSDLLEKFPILSPSIGYGGFIVRPIMVLSNTMVLKNCFPEITRLYWHE